MKLKNLCVALKQQMPLTRFFKNFFVTGRAWGMFHRNSHVSAGTGKPKVMYNTPGSAAKAANAMTKKHGGCFRPYKCVYCDGYHIGKNN